LQSKGYLKSRGGLSSFPYGRRGRDTTSTLRFREKNPPYKLTLILLYLKILLINKLDKLLLPVHPNLPLSPFLWIPS